MASGESLYAGARGRASSQPPSKWTLDRTAAGVTYSQAGLVEPAQEKKAASDESIKIAANPVT